MKSYCIQNKQNIKQDAVQENKKLNLNQTNPLTVPMLLLLLLVRGFCGMVGRAASAGFAPCGTGGFGLTGPPGELEEDVALTRGAGSGLVSPRGGDFSGEPGSDLLIEPLEGLFSETGAWGLAADTCRKEKFMHTMCFTVCNVRYEKSQKEPSK